MTNADPFAGLTRNERAALDELCGRSMLLAGDVQRVAFHHNASFNRVRSILPSYRAHFASQAGTNGAPAATSVAMSATTNAAPPTKPLPPKWSRTRK